MPEKAPALWQLAHVPETVKNWEPNLTFWVDYDPLGSGPCLEITGLKDSFESM